MRTIPEKNASRRKTTPSKWNKTRGRLRIDLTDKETIYGILDADHLSGVFKRVSDDTKSLYDSSDDQD